MLAERHRRPEPAGRGPRQRHPATAAASAAAQREQQTPESSRPRGGAPPSPNPRRPERRRAPAAMQDCGRAWPKRIGSTQGRPTPGSEPTTELVARAQSRVRLVGCGPPLHRGRDVTGARVDPAALRRQDRRSGGPAHRSAAHHDRRRVGHRSADDQREGDRERRSTAPRRSPKGRLRRSTRRRRSASGPLDVGQLHAALRTY